MTAATVTAPKWPMMTTCVLALLALGAAVVAQFANMPTSTRFAVAIAGYVFGCIGAVAAASVHRALENKQRSNPQFRLQPYLSATTRFAMVAGLVGGLACAVVLALEVAK